MATAPRLTPSLLASQALAEFSSDVVVGLGQPGQKELPSKYLYDEVGSALFDVICLLPEYGLSRAGMRLLKRYAPDIISRLNGPFVVAELGSGSGQKTRFLLEALSRRQRVNYYPIDISGTALHRCQQELGARRRDGEHVLVLFLGSTIGNFDRPAGDQFLRDVRNVLREGDALLLATDLEKSVPQLLSAYDDAAGVTAAFNKNLLARINRELDGNFDLSHIEHTVRYDESERRVEMHLRSTTWQRVTLRKAGFNFFLREGETIWTESSHKYNPQEVPQMGERTGYRCAGQWADSEWSFAQNLFFAV
jgi:uncharacterized SAM-dependent methyltransferase